MSGDDSPDTTPILVSTTPYNESIRCNSQFPRQALIFMLFNSWVVGFIRESRMATLHPLGPTVSFLWLRWKRFIRKV